MNGEARIVERFFERQRREILARAERRSARRRSRFSPALLAAAAALLMAGGLALLSVEPAPAPRSAWLWELPLPDPARDEGADLLAAFGPWDDGADAETLVPLPPLFEDEEEGGGTGLDVIL